MLQTLYTVCEGKKEGSEHRDKLRSFPNAYCLLVITSLFVNNERINTIPDILNTGIVQFTWYYIQHNASGIWPADYLVLSGALGKPCTRVIYS